MGSPLQLRIRFSITGAIDLKTSQQWRWHKFMNDREGHLSPIHDWLFCGFLSFSNRKHLNSMLLVDNNSHSVWFCAVLCIVYDITIEMNCLISFDITWNGRKNAENSLEIPLSLRSIKTVLNNKTNDFSSFQMKVTPTQNKYLRDRPFKWIKH